MAKVCNTRARVYETRDLISDEPVEHLESEGERLIKQMVKKQLDTKINLEQELQREKCFKSVAETLPLTEYICGETSLKEFEKTAEEAAHIEELKGFGLSNGEIEILLNFERDILAEKHKKIDKSILSSQIHHILQKVQHAKKEHERSTLDSNTSQNNRHQRELGLCVKPDSEHTKLLNFVLSCQKTKVDSRPFDHPINNLKEIEQELFGHITKRPKKSPVSRSVYRSNKSADSKESFHVYSYQENSTLWDITPEKAVITSRKKTSQSSDHVYTCKPEYLYTVKNGEIIPAHKAEPRVLSERDEIPRSGEVCVVTNIMQSNISLIPLENISKSRLSLQEIKLIPRFSNYVEGSPSKVLFVKNLAATVTNDDLVSLFGHFEKNNVSRVMYRLLTGRMKGQAFITFSSSSIAKEAMDLINGYILKGKPVILQFGKGKDNEDNNADLVLQ